MIINIITNCRWLGGSSEHADEDVTGQEGARCSIISAVIVINITTGVQITDNRCVDIVSLDTGDVSPA